MPTPNMSLTQSDVGSTPGPTWASNVESNWTAVDDHNHASGSGVQITPAGININAALEFNEQQATELKGVVLSNTTASSDNSAVYQSGGDLYWRNAGGVSVQITNAGVVKTTGGSIDGMSGTDAAADYGSGIFTWQFDSTKTPFAGAKMSHADINLYKYDASSGSNAYVQMKYTGTSEGSNILTVPDETATLLSTATSFAGTINVATSSGNAPINLKPNGSGYVVIGNAGATGKLTSNGAYDLILDTNSGTNSSSIAITDAANGNISLIPNGTGEVVIGSGSASGKITSSGAHDLVLDTNAGTDSGTITIVDAANGNIDITPNGSGEVNISKVDINGGTLGGFTIDGNWTAASQTCADLGSVTTCDINGGAIDAVTLGTNSAVTEADIDNININGNTISSTDSNGDINLDCNGTGDIECAADVKTSTTKKVYSKGNCYQTSFHSSLVFGY